MGNYTTNVVQEDGVAASPELSAERLTGAVKTTLEELKQSLDRARVPRGQVRDVTLSELREIARKTQGDVALSMGVAQSRVSKLESGLDMRLSTLSEYLSALDVDLKVTVAYRGRSYSLNLSDLTN